MDYLEDFQFLSHGKDIPTTRKSRIAHDVLCLRRLSPRLSRTTGATRKSAAMRDDVKALPPLLFQHRSSSLVSEENLYVLGAFQQHRRLEQDPRDGLVPLPKRLPCS